MFPVKGFAVSAAKLKIETDNTLPGQPTPRKRKRQAVTTANLADLWESVIESKEAAGVDGKAQPKKEKKPQKSDQATEPALTGAPEARHEAKDEAKDDDEAQPKPKKQKKQKKQQQEQQLNENAEEKEIVTEAPKEAVQKQKEQQPEPQQQKSEKKPTKTAPAVVEEPAEDDEWGGIDDDEPAAQAVPDIKAPTPAAAKPVKEKKEKKEKKPKKSKADDTTTTTTTEPAAAAAEKPKKQAPAPPAAPALKLTPLQASMREKLISARFRHLNESLYTRPSAEAFRLFQDSPEMFSEYHEGFRRQVDVWPENPVVSYIDEVKARAKVKYQPPADRHSPIPSSHPLPRTNGSCTIADLGCGDAALATALEPVKRKLNLVVKSFDLQTGSSPLVTQADIANLPLAHDSVDVVVFCLALMGTNWIDFIEEAHRVLRWKGELWVAEIKSRFALPSKKQQHVVAHSVGNRKKGPAAPAVKKTKEAKSREIAEREAEEEAELVVEVDGVELRQQDTDVTAFVEVLRKRGFVLNKEMHEGAVDFDNKMFVRMHFVKGIPATKGKGAPKVKPDLDGRSKNKKFLADENDEPGREAAVLKPCVYKLR
ncbi:methyltransferase-domain-containing protein [Podospora appendiculata]|uniref:Ribosomal RNA-processing protein 8 n=1 Tax=Podospora appendiculata TaxID=314037 RepID=A0AAE0X926_9PEZI|nr:methyltransferase-domain-containing protein [Podospora appendiculata]